MADGDRRGGTGLMQGLLIISDINNHCGTSKELCMYHYAWMIEEKEKDTDILLEIRPPCLRS
jgi:hypothetical protein